MVVISIASRRVIEPEYHLGEQENGELTDYFLERFADEIKDVKNVKLAYYDRLGLSTSNERRIQQLGMMEIEAYDISGKKIRKNNPPFQVVNVLCDNTERIKTPICSDAEKYKACHYYNLARQLANYSPSIFFGDRMFDFDDEKNQHMFKEVIEKFKNYGCWGKANIVICDDLINLNRH